MADKEQPPIYPDNVEFATAPNDESGKRSKALETYCKQDLQNKGYKVIETRTANGLSVAVYNQRGKLAGHFDSVVKAHKALI